MLSEIGSGGTTPPTVKLGWSKPDRSAGGPALGGAGRSRPEWNQPEYEVRTAVLPSSSVEVIYGHAYNPGAFRRDR